MLIVLAALLLTATATAMLAAQASAIRAQRNIDHCGMIADDMLRAAELPLMQWLSQKADSVVLPPDAKCPRVLVLHDRWAVGPLEHELEIAAYDQCGMVPISVARSGSPLRLEVTSEMLATLDAMPSELIEDQPGLDSFVNMASEQDRSPFPPPIPGDVETFGIAATGQVIDASPHIEADDRQRLGQVIATHNSNPVRININTASIPLLKAALRLAGMGDPELIIQSRQQGKPAVAPQTAHDQLISEFRTANRRPQYELGISDRYPHRSCAQLLVGGV